MKKYFHQYESQTQKNHQNRHHPYLDNKRITTYNNNNNNNNSNQPRMSNNVKTVSVQKQYLKDKSQQQSLLMRSQANNQPNHLNSSLHRLEVSRQLPDSINLNKNIKAKKRNKIITEINELTQPLHSYSHTNQSLHESILSERQVKERGFSLEYLKMAKRHKVKQILTPQSQQSSLILMPSTTNQRQSLYSHNRTGFMNINVNAHNYDVEHSNRYLRAKTQFDYEPSNNNQLINQHVIPSNQQQQESMIRMSTEYHQPRYHTGTKLPSPFINYPQAIRTNLLLNKTLNDLKLPKTSSNNHKFNSKKIKNQHLLTRIQFAGSILQKSHENKQDITQFANSTKMSFIPIDNRKRTFTTDRQFFSSNKIKNTTNTSTFMNLENVNKKTTMRKSKYSPFKSRNGSAASYHEQNDEIEINQFQSSSQFKIKPLSAMAKDVKTYKLTKHKRIKTLNNDNKIQTEERLLNLIDNEYMVKIVEEGLYGQIKLLYQLKQCFQINMENLNHSKKKINPRNENESQHQNKQKQQQKQNDDNKQKTEEKQKPEQKQKQKTPQQAQKPTKISQQKIRQLLKLYVFGEKDQKKYKNLYFSQLDYIFIEPQDKHIIKKIISCERLLVICIVDLLSHERLINLVQEVKLTLNTLIMVYLIVWKQVKKLEMYENIDTQIAQYFDSFLKSPDFKTQSLPEKHLKVSLLPYVENLFRYSKQLFQKDCKRLIEESKTRTINRTFYQTLKKYAIYLTNNQQKLTSKSSSWLISSFATCPAPYILSKPQKRYTLCVDLDQTLLYSKFSCAKKFQTSYRPGAKQFIIQLNKYFEIVVFTSSVKQYADQVIKPFVQFVDHSLYRYHVTRGKNLANTVKDLSRIGRKLQKIIFIDDLECNTKLQPENSIKVTPWKGDMNDKEIIELKSHLLALGKDQTQHDDIRKIVSQIKQKMKSIKKKN